MELGALLRGAREAAGFSLREMALRTNYTVAYLSMIENGKRAALPDIVSAYEREIGAAVTDSDSADGQLAALEWANRVSTSDISGDALDRLELAVDDLAAGYTTSKPDHLLAEVQRHLTYARLMLDGKTTLTEHRRLLVAVGWLSLLAGTCHVDLGELKAAHARISVADSISEESEHPVISAWCLETRAWQRLIDGDFARAVELSRAAQDRAPRHSSVYIQATAQEGRALARLGDTAGTHSTLRRVARLVSTMEAPERPEHHFQYDPAKSDAYVATTLAWLGDPAAESYARHVLADQLAAENPRPRRIATARIDLGLALVAADKPDEAASVAIEAVTSGRLVPSNIWRVTEVVKEIEQSDAPDAAIVREAIRDMYPKEFVRAADQ
ncbi:helix-turn-helix domain-containing protein [Nocardia sp. NPDC004711]